MIFDFFKSVGDPRPCRCSYEMFNEAIKSPKVKALIEQYRKGDADAKRKLPAFAFHATFNGKKRSVKNAVASGLVMVDFDKMESEDFNQLCQKAKQGFPENHCIYLVHITPSGKGIRIVFKASKNEMYEGCNTIADFQKRLAMTLGMEKYLDTVTTDLSRLSFCPHETDILFFDSKIFSDQADITQFAEKSTTVETPVVSEDSGQSTIDNTPLKDVFEKYFFLTGGIPSEGNRNSRFYSAARDLRYICDFNPHVLARHMPNVGLTADEVLNVCISACQSSRAAKVPQIVQDAISQVTLDDDEEDEKETNESAASLPPLPVIFRPFVKICPKGFEEATLLALLPIVGTLASGIRARYLDGELHSPSFITVITAEQASGKSFARRMVNMLLEEIRIEDNAARAVEAAYREELRRKKNAKDQPTDPHVCIRIVPASISVAKLLQRLDYAQQKHLFSFAEELDTVIKSNRSGAWSQKSDIYRNAFDNAEYGQDFMSDNSYSASVAVFYNLLFMGTPRQTRSFFSDVENGLVSRTCFANLPDGFGQQMPVMGSLDNKDRQAIEKQIKMLRSINGEINVQYLLEPINEWLEKQRLLALKENNRARDIFRKRAAVIGFRAAMSVAPCYTRTGANDERIKTFALYIADLVLKNQLKYAGDELNKILAMSGEASISKKGVFDELPIEFEENDLYIVMKKKNMKSAPRQLLYLWRKNNMVEKIEKKKYKKIV